MNVSLVRGKLGSDLGTAADDNSTAGCDSHDCLIVANRIAASD